MCIVMYNYFIYFLLFFFPYRLREEHAKELLKLMEQFDSELEEKKKTLATENEAKLAEEREKREAEFTRRKTQLEEEHDTALDLLRREYREKEEDEEARLEENKQSVLRNMKKKVRDYASMCTMYKIGHMLCMCSKKSNYP